MKSLAASWGPFWRPAATLFQASCEHSSGNTIRLEKNSCQETKGVFCIWCLFAKQWTSLLLKRVWSSVVKNVTPPQVWGRKWQARRGENKREVLTADFFPPGTRHADQLDHRAFQNDPSNQNRNLISHSFLTVFTGTKEVCPEISTPRSSFLSAQGRAQGGAPPGEGQPFSLLLEVSNGGHTWQAFHLVLWATNPGFVLSYRPTL